MKCLAIKMFASNFLQLPIQKYNCNSTHSCNRKIWFDIPYAIFFLCMAICKNIHPPLCGVLQQPIYYLRGLPNYQISFSLSNLIQFIGNFFFIVTFTLHLNVKNLQSIGNLNWYISWENKKWIKNLI